MAEFALSPTTEDPFETVWKLYPRKVGKGAARKSWGRLRPTPARVQEIIQALRWQRNQPQWLKDGGQYVPHFATWLNQERWTDEPFESPHLKDQTVKNLSAAERWANRERD